MMTEDEIRQDERDKLAQAIFDLFEADMADIEHYDKECPEDDPVTYCVHDIRAICNNVLYEVMHKKCGWHIGEVNGKDQLIKGPLYRKKEGKANGAGTN